MAAAGWKGAIAFGPLIRFNVHAAAVDKETKFAFNLHHGPDCGGRLRSADPICEMCGDEVTKDDVVKGYKGYWPVDVAYLKSLEEERSAVLEIDGLVPADQIEPRWYKREYDVLPDAGTEQPYVLFLRLLERADRVAIGRAVIGGKQAIVTLRPRSGLLTMDMMWWPEELKSHDSIRDALVGVEVSEQMLTVGDQLVSLMSKDFDPSEFTNDHAGAVNEYLAALMAGDAPAPVETAPRQQKTSDSLEDALAQTLAVLRKPIDEKVAKKTGRKRSRKTKAA